MGKDLGSVGKGQSDLAWWRKNWTRKKRRTQGKRLGEGDGCKERRGKKI